MMHHYNNKRFVDFLVLLPIWFAFSGLFLYENSTKNMLVIFAISCITSICIHGVKHVNNQIRQNPIIWILLILAGYGVIQSYLHGFSSGMIKTYLAIAIYIVLVPVNKFSKVKNILPTLAFIASISSAVFYFHQTFVLGHTRDNWDIGSLQYVVFLAWIVCLCIVNLIEKKDIYSRALSIISIITCSYIIMVAQGRGIYLTLSLSLFIICVFYAFKRPRLLKIMIPSLMIIFFLAYTKSESIEQRINHTKTEISLIEDGSYDSSIGLRLQMWKAAYYIIPNAPFLGVGENHKQMKRQLAQQGVISEYTAEFNHYHNDFINTLVKNGFIGFILLLATIVYPLSIFIKNKTIENLPIFLLPLIFSLSAMTNVPFTNLHLITFYFCVLWIYKCSDIDNQDKSLESSSSHNNSNINKRFLS